MLFARPKPNLPFAQGQPLVEHLKEVARRAAEFAAEFGCGEYLRVAGLLHDAGKSIAGWQHYLEQSCDPSGAKSKPPNKHAAAGTALVKQRYPGPIGLLLAYLIAGHHAGLPDGCASLLSKMEQGWTLDEWFREGEKDVANIDPAILQYLADLPEPPRLTPPPFIMGSEAHTSQALPFWIRMLFSCLVDADCLDAERIANPAASESRQRKTNLPELLPLLENFLAGFPEPLPGTINAVRKEIQDICRSTAPQESGIYSLSVPTGGGKTLSGLLFALLHAIYHKKRRIIYVIPYTSIIEQTADIFRSIFGEENVLEHHSGVQDKENDSEETAFARLATENWDAPIVVTTNVQFFESLYASRGSKCRKLHNLANSVVVLDEAQLVPVNLLNPCVEALRQLVHGYKTTLLLSTATQPAFPGLSAKEIIPKPTELFRRMKRIKFIWPKKHDDTVSWDTLSAELSRHKSFLCVVNTKKSAYNLWKKFDKDAEVFHLSTLMCPQHRREVLAEIRSRLHNGKAARVVSTQLIEAGVDIDFPVVFRDLAGLDSLAQAAGRCNREGKNDAVSDVHIFIPEEKSTFGIIEKGASIVMGFLRTLPPEELESPDIFNLYFQQLYCLANDTGTSFSDDMAKEARKGHFPFRTLARRFRLLNDDTAPVFIKYRGGEELLEFIRRNGLDRKTLRQAQPYIVSPTSRIVGNLLSQGKIEEIADNFHALTNLGQYSLDTGLDVWNQDIPPESFMV